MARPTSSARRYAEAAFQIALRDRTMAAWRADLAAASAALADDRLARLLANPAVPLESRERLLRTVLERRRVGALPLNLARLLLHRGRIEMLPRVAAELVRLDDLRQGLVHASATSAAPLEPDEIRALAGRLQQLTGGRVELETRVDPSLLGGLVVRLGDRLIDGSVRGRLERLRSRLVSGAI